MTKARLEKIFAWFSVRPARLRTLKAVNLICTAVPCGAFPGVLLWLAVRRETPTALRLLATCGVSFAALSVFRRLLNRPRPCEVYGLPPLLPKKTRGRSFPSRHVFSIFVIGTCFLYFLPSLGAVLLALGVLLAAVRVLSGVHFARDVLAGAAVGVFAAAVGFSLIP